MPTSHRRSYLEGSANVGFFLNGFLQAAGPVRGRAKAAGRVTYEVCCGGCSLWGLGDDETIARFKKETQWNLCTSKKGLQTGVYDMDSIALHNFPLNSITGMRETPPEMEDVALCWWDTWQQLGNAEVVSESMLGEVMALGLSDLAEAGLWIFIQQAAGKGYPMTPGTQLEQLEQQDDLISHSRVPRPAWKTLSFHHICLPMSNSTRDSKVDSVEACK
eukprot:gene10771-12741_t